MSRRRFLRASAAGCAAAWSVSHPLLASSVSGRPYADNLKRLTEWVIGALAGDGIELLRNLPSGLTRGGRERPDLRRLCWLQNCNLFGFHALREFELGIAKTLEESYWRWYRKAFLDVEERTENYLPLGKPPAQSPPAGKFYRTVIKESKQGDYTLGTETYRPDWLGTIEDDDPRSLLKFGALGSHLRNDPQQAQVYFKKALALWGGAGFRTPRREQASSFYTRYLAYALIVERALHEHIPTGIRDAIQQRLWSVQDKDGGLWTNYNRDGSIPALAKKTTEIGPLTLLAYSDGIWR